MLVSSIIHCTAVLIFQLWGVQTLSSIPACPASCICEKTLHVNCASLGLSKAPSHIPATATALDLAHNALHSLAPLGSGHLRLQGLQHLWLGNNLLNSLSMCLGSRGNVGTKTLTRRKERCVSWAPDLELLSADKNQLKYLPRGLGKIKSLKVLQLSHNRISVIDPADLAGCTNLSELHLQHNLINTIHPNAFRDLQKLKVLDVSFNLLATVPVPAYLSLRNLNVLVDISENQWRCDCNLKTIRRWLSFDSKLANPAWEVVCVSPSHHAGKNLLSLEESNLTCAQPVYNTPGVKKEVTVDEGTESILYCSTANQDFIYTRWWTPHGQISDNHQFLYIRNTTENDAGLYVCVSGYQEEHVSVFYLHVRKRAHDRRLRREAQFGSVRLVEEDNDRILNLLAVKTVQQPKLVLAICLSVFITFIVAFVLGVFLRPLLEKCYKQIRNKRNSTTSPSNLQSSSTEQRPYVNEGYSDTDDQVQEVHEGPRVTFGEVTEIQDKAGVPYYVTVEDSPSGSNTDVAVSQEKVKKKQSLTENIEVYKEVPLRKENIELTSPGSTENLNAERGKEMQFDPDPEDTTKLEERSILSPSSLSSKHQEPQMSYEGKESTEQSVDSPTVSIYEDDEQASTHYRATIPGFFTDPFPLKIYKSKEESVDELDPDLWNDSGDSFSFTEGSPRSSRRVSNVAALACPLNQKEMSEDDPSDRPSSCNSGENGESEGGPTEYTVNQEDDKDSETQTFCLENDDIKYSENRLSPYKEDALTEYQITGTGARFRQDTITLDPSDIHMTYTRGESFDDEQFTEYNEYFNSSNISDDSEGEPTQYHVHPVYRTSRKTTILIGEDGLRASSCSNDEDIQGDDSRRLEIRLEDNVPSIDATPSYDDSIFGKIDQTLDTIPRVKRYLNFSQCSPRRFTEEITPNEVVKTESKFTFEDDATAITKGDHFFAEIDASIDNLPKVKWYVQFSPSKSQVLNYSTPHMFNTSASTRPENVSKTEYPPDKINIFFEGQSTSLPAFPKVLRYIQFTQLEPRTVHTLTSTITRDSFFGQIAISLDKVPKVKQYVQFLPLKSQLSNHLTPSASTNQESKPEIVSKTEFSSNKIEIFLEGQSISLPVLPKVQRYLKIMQLEPQIVHKFTPTIKRDSFFDQIAISFNKVPKLKRYVQFSPSESQVSNDLTLSASIKQIARPAVVSKPKYPSDKIKIFFRGQNRSLPALPKVQRYVQVLQLEPQTVHTLSPTIKEDSFFEQIPISFDEVPKVRRHILFSQLETRQNPSKEKYPPTEQITPEIKQSRVTKAHAKPHIVGDHFIGQIAAPLDGVPKVKKYIQFTQSEVFSKTLSSYSPLNEKIPTIQAGTNVKSNNTPSKDCNPVVQEHNFFGEVGVFFDGIPKLRRRIQFTEHSPQPPESKPPSSLKQPATPAVTAKEKKHFMSDAKLSQGKTNFFEAIHVSLDNIPKVNRSLQFTQFTAEPPNQSIPLFFGQIDISFDAVPKVKRYLQFMKSEPHPRPSLKSVTAELVRPEFLTKMQSERSEVVESSPIEGDNFFVQIGASLQGLPKSKRYIQFTQSQLQPLPQSPSLPVITEIVTTEPLTKAHSTRSEAKLNPTIKGDDFFDQTGSSFVGLAKVKRYIQFTLTEPLLLKSLSNKTEKTVKNIASEDYIQPAAGEHSLFEQIGASSEIPKVKRYIQFSERSTQPLSLLKDRQTATSVLTKPGKGQSSSSVAESKSNNEDTFFKKMDGSVGELPKVRRYIQFTQQHSAPLKSSNTHEVIADVAKKRELRGSDLSMADVKTLVTKDHFFGQIETHLISLPRVNRYIQFTQAESYPSSQSQSLMEKNTRKEWNTLSSLTDNEAKSSSKDTFIDEIRVSLDKIPKVTKALLFTPSQYQKLNQIEVKQKVPPHVVEEKTKSDTFSSLSDNKVFPKKQENFLGQLGVVFDEVPKVRRYITFSPSEAYSPAWSSVNIKKSQSPSPIFKAEIVTASATKTESNSADSLFGKKHKADIEEDTFLGQTDTSFVKVPNVKRYIQFINSEPQPSAQSPSAAIITEFVTPEFSTKMYSKRSENKASPTIKRHDFFGQTGSSFGGLPKVKRYIQFTQDESLSWHLLTKKPEKTMTNVASEDYFQPAAGEHSFFGQIRSSSEIPKVKRYIHFSERSTQPLSLPLDRQITTQVLTNPEVGSSSSSVVEVKLNNEDTFFRKMDASVELAKMKNYIQFTQHSTPPKSSNTHEADVAKKRELWGSDLSMADVKTPVTDDHFFGEIETNFISLPRVNRYIQFTQAESYPLSQSRSPKYQNRTATNDKSSNAADNLFASLDLHNQSLVQSEPYISNRSSLTPLKFLSHSNLKNKYRFPSEEEFKLTTKEKDVDGVPKLNRYTQFRQSEPHTYISSSISSQNWEMMDVITESRMFKTNVTPETAKDNVLQQIRTRTKMSFGFTNSNQYDPIQAQSRSQKQDEPSAVKRVRETSRLNLFPEPQRSLSSLNPDAYGQPDQVFNQEEEVYRPTSSNFSAGDNIYANTQGLLDWPESPALQNPSETITDTSTASLEKDDTREYLRDRSLARQRQERRRLLFQQKRRAMDGFSLTSQESDQ